MSETTAGHSHNAYPEGIQIVRAAQVEETATQTSGMTRRLGIARTTTDASKMWMGRVTAQPNMDSGKHHHGESETAGYVVRGQARLRWGQNFENVVDLNPGDFFFVPPHLPHIEQNVSSEEAEFIIARTPDNIVVELG